MKQYIKKSAKKIFMEPRVSYGVFAACLVAMAVLSSVAVYSGKFRGQANSKKHYSVGQQVEVRGIVVAVESVRSDEQGSQVYPLKTGNKFVIPTVVVTNNTDANFELLPLLYFYVKDEQGNVYNVAPAPTRGNQLTGPILPGEKAREEIGFEVPLNAGRLSLYFERGTPDHPVIAIDLSER